MRKIVMTKEDLSCFIQQAIAEYETKHNSPFGNLETISKNMAEKIYTYSKVKRWILEGKIKPIRVGVGKNSKLSIKVSDIAKAQQDDVLEMLSVKEVEE